MLFLVLINCPLQICKAGIITIYYRFAKRQNAKVV